MFASVGVADSLRQIKGEECGGRLCLRLKEGDEILSDISPMEQA